MNTELRVVAALIVVGILFGTAGCAEKYKLSDVSQKLSATNVKVGGEQPLMEGVFRMMGGSNCVDGAGMTINDYYLLVLQFRDKDAALDASHRITDSVVAGNVLFSPSADNSGAPLPSFVIDSINQAFPSAKVQKAESGRQEGADIAAEVNEALAMGDRMKTTVAEYYSNIGVMPNSCAPIGGCPPKTFLRSEGQIVVSLGTIAGAGSQRGQIAFAPSINANGDVSWTCSSNGDSSQMPPNCRNPLAYISEPIPTPVKSEVLTEGGVSHPSSGAETNPISAPASAAAPAVTVASTPSQQAASSPAQSGAPAAQLPDEKSASNTQPSSIPVPVNQIAAALSNAETASVSPSFDCAKASTNVEKMICANPALSKADSEMAGFYKRNMVASGAGSNTIKQGQRAFVAKRNLCSDSACVADAYRARREEMAQMGYVRE